MASDTAYTVLLRACAGRDRDAFERLYRQSAPRLFGLCLSMVGRRDLAEDVLQESFLQIWRDAPRFDPERASAPTWMATIVRHRALDAVRRARSGIERITVPEGGDGGPLIEERRSPEPEPLEWALAGAERSALQACLATLSQEQQRSILLAFLQGMSHAELSEAMAAPVGTVKSWIRRGLAHLRRCLES